MGSKIKAYNIIASNIFDSNVGNLTQFSNFNIIYCPDNLKIECLFDRWCLVSKFIRPIAFSLEIYSADGNRPSVYCRRLNKFRD
jgi:hypothetical protein